MHAQALLIEVRFIDGRYHGTGDWPPSPFRLFQALVAGAYGGRFRAEPEADKDTAFRWLEKLDPPLIVAPAKHVGRTTIYFVPNNDLDAVGGDPRRISEIRVGKTVRPILFDAGASILYVWPFSVGETEAGRISALAERLHTLGRGTDAAYARAEVCDWPDAETRMSEAEGAIARPARPGRPDDAPSCPTSGSLDSLKARHEAGALRFQTEGQGRKSATLFRQPPKATFRAVRYDCPPARLLFELRRADDPSVFHAVVQERTVEVTMRVRDLAAVRLKAELPPERGPEIDRLVVGRGAGPADLARRVIFLPLPSIGMAYTDPRIRRVLVELPRDCPFTEVQLSWALSGQSPGINPDTGEVIAPHFENAVLTAADDISMLRHYDIGNRRPARRWRTVTPAALVQQRRRGRIGGAERAEDEAHAASAVAGALRHAGHDPLGVDIRVQAEPFRRAGEQAERFEPNDPGMGPRFGGRLRHVEVTFPTPVPGPLVIGDGRFLGLGLMAPVTREEPPALQVFTIDHATAPPTSAVEAVTQAFRRAIMARVDVRWRNEAEQRGEWLHRHAKLPPFFSGHKPDGTPAGSGRHEHLFFLADDTDGDGRLDRLAVVAPGLADRSRESDAETRRERQRETRRHLRLLDRALAGMTQLKAGRAGVVRLSLSPDEPGDEDALFGRARVWVSRTPYRPTRHPHRISAEVAVRLDVVAECGRRGLPRPEVEVLGVASGPRGGLAARVRLSFSTAVPGPILLGRGSHFGAGLFRVE